MLKTAHKYTPCSSKNRHFPVGLAIITNQLRTESLADEGGGEKQISSRKDKVVSKKLVEV